MKILDDISRRVMLRGLGASICLPLLESFAPRQVFAESKTIQSPKRMIFLSYSWGVSRKDWFPAEVGADYTMTECLKPLAKHRKDFSVLSHLSNMNARQGHWKRRLKMCEFYVVK